MRGGRKEELKEGDYKRNKKKGNKSGGGEGKEEGNKSKKER